MRREIGGVAAALSKMAEASGELTPEAIRAKCLELATALSKKNPGRVLSLAREFEHYITTGQTIEETEAEVARDRAYIEANTPVDRWAVNKNGQNYCPPSNQSLAASANSSGS